MKATSFPDLPKGDLSPAEGRDTSKYARGPSAGAGGLELFSSTGSQYVGVSKPASPYDIRELPPFGKKGRTGAVSGSKPGPACSRGSKPGSCTVRLTKLDTEKEPGMSGSGLRKADSSTSLGSVTPLPSDEDVFMDVEDTEEETGEQGRKRSRQMTKRNPISSPSDSEEEPPKKGRGRPAKDPSHEGQLKAEALAQKAEAKKAKKLKRDQRAILDPESKPSSERASRANDKALERAEELEEQPMATIAAIMTRSLGMMAKSVERSTNIQGPIRKDLWTAYTDLTAGLTTMLSRQAEGEEARQRREESAALAKARAKWASERQKLEAELGQLRTRVALLERISSARAETQGGRTDVEVQIDLDLNEEAMEALVGEVPHQPTSTEGIEVEPSTEEFPPLGAKIARRKGKPVAVSVECLKEPIFRPPLKGVRKQLNPLSKAVDITVAPSRPPTAPLPSALSPAPLRPTKGARQAGVSGRRREIWY